MNRYSNLKHLGEAYFDTCDTQICNIFFSALNSTGYYFAFHFSLNNMNCYRKHIIRKNVISLVTHVHAA